MAITSRATFNPAATPPPAAPAATQNFDLAGLFGVATQAIGGIAGAFAIDQQGQNDAAYEYFQAEVARINADIKLDQQKDILRQGQIQLGEESRQVGEAIASNIAAQGGSGFQVSEDSIDAISRMGDRQSVETRKSIENSFLQVGYEALGLETSAVGHEMSARNKRSSARTTALTKGIVSVGNAAVKLGAFTRKGN